MLFDELGLPDCVWLYDDLAYKNGLFASPELLQKLFMPYYAEINGFFHGKGLKVVLHSCGDVTNAIPLIIDAGFDGLQPMEVKAGCDPFAIAETYGNKLVLIGGLDVRVLETNQKELICKEVENLIGGMKKRNARYIFHSDHSITPNVRYDSYRYALDVYEKNKMLT
jgi:uroporphyrinogen decarboxylase